MHLQQCSQQCRMPSKYSSAPLRAGTPTSSAALPAALRTCLYSSAYTASANKHASPASFCRAAVGCPSRRMSITSATAVAKEPVAFVENIQDKELHLEASESYLSVSGTINRFCLSARLPARIPLHTHACILTHSTNPVNMENWSWGQQRSREDVSLLASYPCSSMHPHQCHLLFAQVSHAHVV